MSDISDDEPIVPRGTDLRPDGVIESVDERLARQVTDPNDVRRRLADATRAVMRHLVSSTAADEDLEAAAAAVTSAAEQLDASTKGRSYFGVAEGSLLSEHREFIDYSPLTGLLNPLAPPMNIWREGDTVLASATFGPQYEGPPGCVHGGFVAAAFDEILGVTQSLTGRAGMTAHLAVDYRSPTPLHRELRFTGRVDRTEGRKIFTTATLHDGDRLCAESMGLFVSMRPEVFERLLRIRLGESG
jgi:acyl-coenzyme A thioesterase PaaI-like protein